SGTKCKLCGISMASTDGQNDLCQQRLAAAILAVLTDSQNHIRSTDNHAMVLQSRLVACEKAIDDMTRRLDAVAKAVDALVFDADMASAQEAAMFPDQDENPDTADPLSGEPDADQDAAETPHE
ncbi:MAG: hypothetical protein M3O61_18605, partial [Gemmatimonadota bacterium]|nr:hypothetical protein [Gemmatimonadota bacterium]